MGQGFIDEILEQVVQLYGITVQTDILYLNLPIDIESHFTGLFFQITGCMVGQFNSLYLIPAESHFLQLTGGTRA